MNIREVYDSIDRKQISFNCESLNYFQGDGYHPNSNDCYDISTLFDNGMSKWKKKSHSVSPKKLQYDCLISV